MNAVCLFYVQYCRPSPWIRLLKLMSFTVPLKQRNVEKKLQPKEKTK